LSIFVEGKVKISVSDQFYMFDGWWYKILLSLKITVLTSTVAFAQSPINKVQRLINHQSNASHYYIVELLDYNARFGFQRKIDRTHFIVEAHDTIYSSTIIGPANDLWKLPNDNTGNLSFPSTFLINVKDGEAGKMHGTAVLQRFHNALSIRITTKSQFEKILHDPRVIFIKKLNEAHEESPNSVQDISVNKINVVHRQHPDLNGNGVTIAIKERLIDTTDIDLKNRVIVSTLADKEISLHANQIATIAAGAGNTIPSSKGIAWSSNLLSTSYDNLLPDDASVLKQYGVSVQNHSYGTDIENF